MNGGLFVHGGEQTLPVEQDHNGNPFITITPLRLGHLELELAGRFPDGGVVGRRFNIEVEPSLRSPEQISVGSAGGHTDQILMSVDDRHITDLELHATYANISVPIDIDPAFARFSVSPEDDSAPITLDQQTGILTARHPGQALIETSFGGRTNLTCIDVEQHLVPGRSYFEKACQHLLPPGVKLGPQN